MLRALGSVSCDITHDTGGTICYGHWALRLVTTLTKQGVRFVAGIGFCVLYYHTRDKGYDLLLALGSALDLRLVISHTRQGVQFVTGLGSAVDLRLVISHTRQRVRVVTGIGFCVL